MLLGLDHVIIAVRDLPSAMERFAHALGLTVTAGGDHPGSGTHNAIVSFGTEYIEIISVRDQAEAATSERGRIVRDFLSSQGDGLLGLALGTDTLDTEIAGAASRGVPLVGPVAGSRRRPDGSMMAWQLGFAAGDPFGRALPFFIQHDTPLAERRQWTPPGGHPLGATGIPLLSVAVGEMESSVDGYRRLLGKEPEVIEDVPALPARRARFAIGEFRLELLQPQASSGGLAEFVRTQGDGLFMITLSVPDVGEAVAALRQRGTAVGDPTPRRRAPLLDPSQTLGSRFQLVEGS